MKKSVERAPILTPPEVRQLTRVHRQIGALLASNGVTLSTARGARTNAKASRGDERVSTGRGGRKAMPRGPVERRRRG